MKGEKCATLRSCVICQKNAKCPVGFPHNKRIFFPNVNSLKAVRKS